MLLSDNAVVGIGRLGLVKLVIPGASIDIFGASILKTLTIDYCLPTILCYEHSFLERDIL